MITNILKKTILTKFDQKSPVLTNFSHLARLFQLKPAICQPWSWGGGTFLEAFILKGPKGGAPQKILNFFWPNVSKLIDRKSDHKTFQYI